MQSPAAAIAWEFRHRHRWGWIALTGYLVVLVTTKLIPGPGLTFHMDSAERFGVVVMGPLTATIVYVLAVFSFGLAGDLAARQSIYPSRMFTLPVTTAALAGWPMLYGSAAMTALWLATRFFARWPSGVDVPVIWPALLAAALLAWTQALTWMPYPLPGLRVIVSVLWLGVIDTVALLALHYRASEAVMLAIVAPQLPLAYLVARVAVARARRGDVPDWRGVYARLAGIASLLPSRRRHFRSAERAQVWFEWRQHGRTLPALVGILLPFELALLFASGSPAFVFGILLGALLTPPFMAVFVAPAVGKSNPYVRDFHGVTPFIATRPVTGAALIAAKLKATIRSTLAAWLLVLVAIPLALHLSGTLPMVIERVRRFTAVVGAPHAIVIGLLGLAGFMASTWKRLVQGLYIGLTGRGRLVKADVFLTLAFLVAVGPIAEWVMDHPAAQAALWNALPWILGVLICFKLSAAAWVATRLYRGRVLDDRTLVIGAAWWCVSVLALYGVLAWLFNTPFFPRYLLGFVAILAVPLARLSAAPLALAWNRHR